MFKIFGRGRGEGSEGDLSPEMASSSPSISSLATGPARPIRLVYCDEKGKFRMDPEAVAILQLVKGPVGIVSVCGRGRQGKSFILNQLLGRSSGFQVASTHRPCTKGLWLWSAPLKRTAIDGSSYSLLLIDSEGIDAYDQTGTYSTQIFSLAVLLSSMFIYNQMGGIDEAALDRLSLVTQMTKHIRVRASGAKTSTSELGQFSPIFVWLLRDFYLDLVEDDRKITPRDYLEIALKPVNGSGKDINAKNEIRDSIRALFPDRECYTLVRPLNKENDLQRLDQIPLDKLRPEFRAGLDALTRFVFERTRPKQVAGTVMTGPILVGLTESYLEALNNGAVPTISTSWQSVEETECRRAYDAATETYMSNFDRTKPPDEGAIREAYEDALRKALVTFNANAVGVGSARKKYEELLHKFVKKAFEDYKRTVFVEADLRCANAIQSMERKLRAACHASDASIDNVVKVVDTLVAEYEASSLGPKKWNKLAVFLQQSLEGPICDLVKRLNDKITMDKSALTLKCRSIEDKLTLLSKQLEVSEKNKAEFMRRYDEAINERKKLTDDYIKRISDLQNTRRSQDERCSSLVKALETSKQESSDWKRKHDLLLSKRKADEDHSSSEIGILKSRSSAAEARLAAAQEQVKSSQEEAAEWKRKYDSTVKETKLALEKAAIVQERSNKETQLREDALREEFSSQMAERDEELKEKSKKIESAERSLATLNLELKTSEARLNSYVSEISSLKSEMKELVEKLELQVSKAQSFEHEANILEQEKNRLEQKYMSESKRLVELEKRCSVAENEAKRATELVEHARSEAASAQKQNIALEKVVGERIVQCEKAQRNIDSLERQKADLMSEIERIRHSEMDAVAQVAMLEARVEEREREIESLLERDNEERTVNVRGLQDLLDRERKAHQEANKRAEDYSRQLENSRAKVDRLQQELTSVRLTESALDSKLKSVSQSKRTRTDDHEGGVESAAHEFRINNQRYHKKSRSTTSPMRYSHAEDGGSVFKGDDDHEDYTKFTVQRLKQELTKHNFGEQVLQLRNPNKKELVALYEKCILQKS